MPLDVDKAGLAGLARQAGPEFGTSQPQLVSLISCSDCIGSSKFLSLSPIKHP